MTFAKDAKRISSTLILVTLLFALSLTYATTENNYNNDNNFLTGISESTHTESGYKTNIVINPDVTGIYAKENGYELDLEINSKGIGGSLKEGNYRLDLIPEKSFPEPTELRRDVAVTKMVVSKTVVPQTYTVFINATIENQGDSAETFNVDVKANTTSIQTQSVTIESKGSTTVTFTWNTTGFAKGIYAISAHAWSVPGETDTSDNTLAGGWVIVAIIGDVNGDKIVDVFDLIKVAIAFGSKPGDASWNPNADLKEDNLIDVFDLIKVAIHFGETTP